MNDTYGGKKRLEWTRNQTPTHTLPHDSLSTIRNADLICVVFNGRIVEQGTHEELIARPDSRYSILASTMAG